MLGAKSLSGDGDKWVGKEGIRRKLTITKHVCRSLTKPHYFLRVKILKEFEQNCPKWMDNAFPRTHGWPGEHLNSRLQEPSCELLVIKAPETHTRTHKGDCHYSWLPTITRMGKNLMMNTSYALASGYKKKSILDKQGNSLLYSFHRAGMCMTLRGGCGSGKITGREKVSMVLLSNRPCVLQYWPPRQGLPPIQW